MRPLSKFLALFRRRRAEREMAAELQSHLDALAERHIAAGMVPNEACNAARREFGGVEQIKERCRDERRWPSFEDLIRDVRNGIRQWRRKPGLALVCICILALGIGACTAVYSTIDAVLLRPSAGSTDRVMVLRQARLPDVPDLTVSVPNYLEWRRQLKSFASLSAYTINAVNLTGAGDVQRVTALDISPEYFEVYAVKPLLGRFITPEECEHGERVAVLSYSVWQSEFGGSTDVVGRPVEVDGDRYTVIGVAPRTVEFTTGVALYRPLVLTPKMKDARGRVVLTVLGRLRAGISATQADAELRTVVARLATAMHESDGTTAFAMTIAAYEKRDIHAILLALLGAVVCVLLVACANVANLLLVRGTQRQREIAVRVALGATRGRIVRQLLIESLLLAVAGGAVGVLVAVAELHAVRTLAPPSLATLQTVHVHAPILVAALVLSIATGLVFGVAPAWMSSQFDVNHGLKQSAATASASRNRTRFRSTLVAFEFAAALVLLTGAGLLTRSFNALSQLGTGLDVSDVSYALLTLPPRSYSDAARRVEFARSVLEGVHVLPNVAAVAAANTIPLRGGPVVAFLPAGMHVAGPTDMPVGWMFTVSPDYFSVIHLPLLRGRTFAESDAANSPRVLIINRTLARQYFPNEDPVGRYVSVAGTKCEIIGIVADVAQVGLGQLSSPQLYGAFAQWPIFTSSFNLMIRARGAAAVTRQSVRSIVSAVDPALSVGALVPLQESLDLLLARQRFAMTLLNIFGIIGALIAAAGVYSVMAYATSQRSTEIGIRMAFGASTRDIFSLVMRQGAAVTGLGALAGIAAALVFTRLIGSMLYEVQPHDPLTLALATIALTGIVLIACVAPAFRTLKLNPVQVLRAE